MISKAEKAPTSVIALCIATMLIAISTGMTFSISPFFMTQVLGLSITSLGAIEGVTEALSQFCKLFAGISGDLFKRKKPTLLVGFILATISKPLFILANGSMLVVASKAIERISNGVMATPRDAFIASESPKEQIGSYLGIMMTMKTIGIALGSAIVTILISYSKNYRMLLWVGFIPCILSILICYFYMTESEQQEPKIITKKSKKKAQKLSFKDIKSLPPEYWSILGVAILFMAARFTDGFLILRLRELGAPDHLSTSAIGIFNLISALCCFPIGRISDKFGRTNILMLVFLALIMANLCLIFTYNLTIAILGLIFWGVQRGPSQMLFATIISDIAPPKILGSALGLYYLITGFIAILSGCIVGKISEHNLVNAFIFGSVISTLALTALMLKESSIGKKTPKERFAS